MGTEFIVADSKQSPPFRKVLPIVSHGKLPYSHYYDVIDPNLDDSIIKQTKNNSSPVTSLSRASSLSSGISTSTAATHPQDHQQNSQQFSYDSRLQIWTCVFSPEGSHLAWSCGNGLVKLMCFRKTRKRSVSQSFESEAKRASSAYDDMSSSSDQISLSSTNTSLTQQRSHSINIPLESQLQPAASTSNETTSSQVFLLNNSDTIREIDCGEIVWSLAFGSSLSQVKHRRDLHEKSRVNTRFDLARHKLILAVGLASGKIRIYNAFTAQFLFVLFDHKDVVRNMKFTRDGSLQLASTSLDETIKLWNFYDDGNMYKTLRGHTGTVNACDWSPTASLLCSVGVSRQAIIWDTETYLRKHVLRGHLHDVVACEFSPDGALVATASYDTKIILWNPFTGEAVRQFCHMMPPPRLIFAGGHNGAYVRSIAFSKNGDHLVSICDDKKIRMWSLCSTSAYPMAEGEHEDGLCCAYVGDSRLIMVGTRRGHVEMYEAPCLTQPSLKHICRKALNQIVDRTQVSELHLPGELKKYLIYDDIKEKQK